MHYGVQVRPTTNTVDLRELGRQVEAAGFASLWFPEHTHMPVQPEAAAPGAGEWLDTNTRLFDPLIALTAVAGTTEHLLLGTGILLLPQHDPILLAKQIATLDVLSGGRVLLGIGAGWNRAEMRHHGVNPPARFRRMHEQVMAMRTIWTQEIAEFQGNEVRFGPLRQWPKPVQQPGPPILIGGEGQTVLDRVLAYGDAWLPNDHPEVEERIAELHQRCLAAGRAPIPAWVYSVEPDPARVRTLTAAGAAACIFTVPNDRTGPEAIEAALHELRSVVTAAESANGAA